MTLTGLNKHDQRETEQRRNMIKAWLLELKYSVEEKQAPNEIWVLEAFEANRGFGFSVGAPKGYPHALSIAVTFSFEDFQSELDRLPAGEREQFIIDLWHLLLGFDLEFRPQGEPLTGVMLVAYVYVDELKRSVFWRYVRTIRRAFWTTLWTFQKKFNRPMAEPPVEFIETVQ